MSALRALLPASFPSYPGPGASGARCRPGGQGLSHRFLGNVLRQTQIPGGTGQGRDNPGTVNPPNGVYPVADCRGRRVLTSRVLDLEAKVNKTANAVPNQQGKPKS